MNWRTSALAAMALAIMLAGGSAVAGELNGPVIRDVNWDAAFYAPGRVPQMLLTLRSPSAMQVVLSVSVTDSWGHILPPPLPQTLTLASAQAMTARFHLSVPIDNWRGYHVDVEARAPDGRILDSASGAFDVASDWKRFPRYCFVTGASVTAGSPIETTVRNLVSYKCNAIQWYDVNWKHQHPFDPVASWPNIANIMIDRATLERGLRAAHDFGIVNFDYELWNGAWDNYWRDGTVVHPDWGLYRTGCDGPCSERRQVRTDPFPRGWATNRLYQMDPSNPHWQQYWRDRENEMLTAFGFDGVQIDTLGDPGMVTNSAGKPTDPSSALVPFTNAASAAFGRRVILNPVSEWNLDAVTRHAAGDVIYTEIHPEFGDIPFFPGLNGLAARIHDGTFRQPVIAAYLETRRAKDPNCHTAGGHKVCTFSSPGIRYADSQFLASGLDHWEIGDSNNVCSVRQAKLASDIYVPGPALCMDADLQEWEQDARNFEVAYENILRDGITDAPDLHISATNLPGGLQASVNGAAGTLYILPKVRPGFIIIHLLNFGQLSSIRLDDPDGRYPPPQILHDVRLSVSGVRLKPSRVWWASPDALHGRPQPLAWHMTSGRLEVTLPSLDVWDMLVISREAPS